MDEIDRDVIDVIRLAKLKEASRATTNRYLALVRAILFKSRDEWEWLEKVPKIKLFKETADRERSLTPEQAQDLLRELPAHQCEYVMFALAIASRISEVKQMRKAQGYFVGGRRAFGFDVIEGKKVPNSAEQKLIKKMREMRSAGQRLLSIHRWLNDDQGVKLAYSSLRGVLL